MEEHRYDYETKRQCEPYDRWDECESDKFFQIERLALFAENLISEDELQRHEWRKHRIEPELHCAHKEHYYECHY